MDFSVVITTKNRYFFLSRAISSVCSNDILPTDIVVINDGGECIDLKGLSTASVAIKIINNSISKGANYSRNLGIKEASSDIVFLLDDDDALDKFSFSSRLPLFQDEAVGIAFTGLQVVSSNSLTFVERNVLPVKSDDYFRSLLREGNVIGSTSRVAIRRKWFYRAGQFDEQLKCLQDYDLWIRMAQISKVCTDNTTSLIYTIHADGRQVSSNFKKYIEASNYLVNKYSYILTESCNLKGFKSNLYLRVAISASKNSTMMKLKYSFLSFINKPSLKSFVLFVIPRKLLHSCYKFI
jgi:glycosyltransferase involved in cell wall biosynthesis